MRTGTRSSKIEPDAAPLGNRVTAECVPSDLLSEVDTALQQMVGRGLVDSVEVVDLLLDLRSRMVLELAFAEMTNPNRSTNGV
jgi:hypothetical protein